MHQTRSSSSSLHDRKYATGSRSSWRRNNFILHLIVRIARIKKIHTLNNWRYISVGRLINKYRGSKPCIFRRRDQRISVCRENVSWIFTSILDSGAPLSYYIARFQDTFRACAHVYATRRTIDELYCFARSPFELSSPLSLAGNLKLNPSRYK